MQTLVNFFSFEFGWDTAFRLAAVIASLLIAYRVPIHTSRDRLHAAGQFLIMYAAGILVHLSVFFTAQMFRELVLPRVRKELSVEYDNVAYIGWT